MNGKALFIACLFLLAVQALAQNTLKEYCRDRTFLGTSFGAPCASSYKYKGVTYNNECTRRDHFRWWCATEEGDFKGNWGNCLSADCAAFCDDRTTGGNGPKEAACKFPFTYKGKRYEACTTIDNNGKLWCSKESVYKTNWGNCAYDASCAANYCRDRTVQGTARGAPCVTPFMYKGVQYTDCTNRDHNRLWCSTTASYNGNWGNCLPKDCKKMCTDRTVRGTAKGAPCVLPFTYKGKSYDKCTTVDNNDIPWCSTTPVYTNKYGACLYEC